jgi:predicted anti-sigma-YlaC factor YlaD
MREHRLHGVPKDVCDYNIRLDQQLRRVSDMNLKRWKLLKAGISTVAVLVFSGFAISEGADPTSTGLVALLVVAALNGIDVAELLSVWAEVRASRPRDDGDDGGRGG